MNRKMIILWAYGSEILLTSLIVIFSLVLWSSVDVVAFITSKSSDLATYFSLGMFATSTAFFWAFYSKSDAEFAGWLYRKGAYKIYEKAYLSAIALYALLTTSLIVVKILNNEYFSLFTFWLLILGLINSYTFISNISGQLRLNMEYNRLKKRL